MGVLVERQKEYYFISLFPFYGHLVWNHENTLSDSNYLYCNFLSQRKLYSPKWYIYILRESTTSSLLSALWSDDRVCYRTDTASKMSRINKCFSCIRKSIYDLNHSWSYMSAALYFLWSVDETTREMDNNGKCGVYRRMWHYFNNDHKFWRHTNRCPNGLYDSK